MRNINDSVAIIGTSVKSNYIVVTSGRIVGIKINVAKNSPDLYNVLSIDGNLYSVSDDNIFDSFESALETAKSKPKL